MAHLTSVVWSGLKRIDPYLTCRCLEDSAVLRYHNDWHVLSWSACPAFGESLTGRIGYRPL